jgi:anti-sigma B factor antagonist
MSAKVITRHVVTILEVSGRITMGEGGIILRDAIREALKSGAKNLILDLGQVSYMDSTGVGELTSAYTSAKNAHCELKLLNLTRKIDDLLQITKLATIFDIFTDEKEAIASFKS